MFIPYCTAGCQAGEDQDWDRKAVGFDPSAGSVYTRGDAGAVLRPVSSHFSGETPMSAEDVKDFYKEFKQAMGTMQTEMPDAVSAFQNVFQSTIGEGELSVAEKECVALGIAVAIQCLPCIRLHVKKALEAGVSRKQILEVCGVAMMMGGGPAYTHVQEVLDALEANDA
jgi:AhpD family alkylhydroperoxidase